MTSKIIGYILILAPFVVLYIWNLTRTIYWLWLCLKDGGDYKYYLTNLATMIAITMIVAGLVLVI